MGSSSSTEDCEENLPEETDTEERIGEVYLVKCAISSLASLKRSSSSRGLMNHWSLVIKFHDELWIVMEALCVRGSLTPYYRKMNTKPIGTFYTFNEAKRLKDVFDMLPGSLLRRLLLPTYTHVKTSPNYLRTLTGSNVFNDIGYIPSIYDCQLWVMTTSNKLKNKAVEE